MGIESMVLYILRVYRPFRAVIRPIRRPQPTAYAFVYVLFRLPRPSSVASLGGVIDAGAPEGSSGKSRNRGAGIGR